MKIPYNTLRDIATIQMLLENGETQRQIHLKNPKLITRKTYKKYCDKYAELKARHETALEIGRANLYDEAIDVLRDSERDFYDDYEGKKKQNSSAVQRDKALADNIYKRLAQQDAGLYGKGEKESNSSTAPVLNLNINGLEIDKNALLGDK